MWAQGMAESVVAVVITKSVVAECGGDGDQNSKL
jgi:hypothetical protein